MHLLYLSGFGTRVRVFLSWIWSYLTWARGARLIPSEPEMHAQQLAQAARPPAHALEEHALEEQPPAPQPH